MRRGSRGGDLGFVRYFFMVIEAAQGQTARVVGYCAVGNLFY